MRDGWRRVTLGDIAEVVGGGTPRTSEPSFWGGEIPWITPTEVVAQYGSVITSTTRSLTAAGLKGSGARLLPTGSVLLTSRATVGAVGLTGCPMATNQGFASLVPGDAVLADFLMFWCQANVSEFQIRAGGSTFPEINRGAVREVALDLPPLDEQRRIVDLVGALDGAIDAARDVIKATEGVAMAIRHEISEHGDLVNLGSVLRRIESGASPTTEGRPPVLGEAGVLKLSAVRRGVFIRSEAKAVASDAQLPESGRVANGDILMTRSNTAERVGDVCLVEGLDPDQRLYLPDLILRLVPNEERIAPEYLVESLLAPGLRSTISGRATGTSASMKKVNRAIVRALPLRVPGREAQDTSVSLTASARAAERRGVELLAAFMTLRSGLLTNLLSEGHTIPSSYNRFLKAA